MTRHAALERSEVVKRRNPLLAHATSLIAHPTIRARATFGGSMAHADPAAEYPSVALAMGAELVALSQRGERHIAANTFFRGLLTTELVEDELLVEVRLPEQPTDEGWAYEELATRPGDYATVGVIARLGLGSDGRCRTASLICTAVGPTPLLASQASAALVGELPTLANFDVAAALAAAEVTPESDALTSASYKRAMTRVLTGRALESALRRVPRS
jgi:CO/xanthine dehydrogenase FAD-binding subunit